MPRTLKSKKVQGIFGKMFILALLSLAVFLLQNRISDFYQSSLGNEVDLRDKKRFPQKSWLKIKISKNRRHFLDESTDNNDINIFLSLENLFASERKDLKTHF